MNTNKLDAVSQSAMALQQQLHTLDQHLNALFTSPEGLAARSHPLLEALDATIAGASAFDAAVREALGPAAPPTTEVMGDPDESK